MSKIVKLLPKLKGNQTIFSQYAVLFFFTIISILWTANTKYKYPPMWEMVASIFCLIAGYSMIVYTIIQIFQLRKPIYSGAFAFDELLETIPELRGALDEIKSAVNSGKLEKLSQLFQSHMSELYHESPSYIGEYYNRKLNQLFKKIFFGGIIGVILIFACIYIADYTLEMYFFQKPGFHRGENAEKINIPYFIVESVYYSTTTYSTLGYGDIYPGTSIIARLASIFEVLTSYLIIVLLLNTALLRLSQQKDMISQQKMMEFIEFYIDE